MSYCVFIIRQFREGSCLIVFLLLDVQALQNKKVAGLN
jgi:hypothetical protein